MNSLKRAVLSLFLLTSISLFAGEEDPPIIWGEVPHEDLAMTSYPADSNATAIILCDYGEVHFNQNYNLVFSRHTRVKILSNAGFKWGTVEIPYYARDKTQQLDDIEAHTLWLGAKGKVMQKVLDDREVFDVESNKNWHKKKFTLPSLAPGCVIEYRYTMTSSPLYMPDWAFQTTEPTCWSEFRLKNPYVFGYVSVLFGHENFFINKEEQTEEVFLTSAGTKILPVVSSRTVLKDAPALREEPFMTTVDDYTVRMKSQLSVINWPGAPATKYLESWKKLAEELGSHSKLGRQLNGFSAIRKQAEAIVANLTDTLKKIEAIYDFVRTTLVWNGQRRVFVENDLDDVLEAKTGSSAEINLLLTSMLREAGLRADPVLLSTRSNGIIQSVYPIVDQFDYVIAKVVTGKLEFLLDATDRFRPFTFLPQRALNHTGYLLRDKTYEWVSIVPTAKGSSRTVVNMQLTNDAAISGSVQKGFSDYGAMNERQAAANRKQDEYVRALLQAEAAGLTVDSFAVNNKDSVTATFFVDAKVSSSTYAQVLDDFIYLNPVVVDRSTSNPFKLAKRNFPVDYSYPLSHSYKADIVLPDDYVLKEFPKDRSISLPHNAGSYARTTKIGDHQLETAITFEMNKIVFNPPEYETLRRFYDQIVTMESEQMVLQKKPIPTVVPAPASVPKPKKKR